MTKSRLAVTVSALLLLSGCASSPATSQSIAPTVESSPVGASFASYIQGDWTCETPQYTGTSLEFPVFGVTALESSEISIGDGTWSASWGEDSDDKAEGTWKIEGREIFLTSPLGVQIIGNLPESPEQAMEPMRLRISDTQFDETNTIQVLGERTVAIKTAGNKYATDCAKF